MSEHAREPGEQIERSADQLEQDLERLEGHLDDAKDRLKERAQDAQGPGPAQEAAGDWEDQAPDRPLGGRRGAGLDDGGEGSAPRA
jgi:hypothetical protein